MWLYDPVLYPFSLLYDGITRFRNRMFDLGMKKSINFEVPTVVVGNLSLGGTGKTPMVEFLIKKFKSQYHIVTLSRGYGRKSSGFLMVKDGLSPQEVGDEPFQIYSKFGREISVAVGEERILAIPQILAELPYTNLILLDDAFQHRYVKGDINILLTTYQKPFFRDRVLPMGTLREHPKGAQRADIIVVTKCPANLDHRTKEDYEVKIRAFSGIECLIVFGQLKYGLPYNVFEQDLKISHYVILLSGIADNQMLIEEVRKDFELLETLEYSDHHTYTDIDLTNLLEVYAKHARLNPSIITTEKDAVKLKDVKFKKYLKEIPIFALPVEISLTELEEEALLKLTTKAIGKKII